MHPPSSTPDFPHIGPLTVIVISRLSNSNLRFCVSSRLLYSGLEASEISLSSSAGQAIRPAVASMRSVGDLRSWFSNIWRTIGRQPNNRSHVTEPGVQGAPRGRRPNAEYARLELLQPTDHWRRRQRSGQPTKPKA